nr:hypothetical protein CFP56_76056 [Quercus suber]
MGMQSWKRTRWRRPSSACPRSYDGPEMDEVPWPPELYVSSRTDVKGAPVKPGSSSSHDPCTRAIEEPAQQVFFRRMDSSRKNVRQIDVGYPKSQIIDVTETSSPHRTCRTVYRSTCTYHRRKDTFEEHGACSYQRAGFRASKQWPEARLAGMRPHVWQSLQHRATQWRRDRSSWPR